MELSETLNRTVKLAMDEGRVASYEDAQALFASFRLRISVGEGFSSCPAAEAAVLTLLKAAPKTFLGGVELEGALDERCTLAWYGGMTLADVSRRVGVEPRQTSGDPDMPVLRIGAGPEQHGAFSLAVSLFEDGFELSPDVPSTIATGTPIDVGVAAAGAALNEVFSHSYRHHPLAGCRNVRFRMPQRGLLAGAREVWLVGLGHLGQAYLWTLALSHRRGQPLRIRLTDFDRVTWSSLSTCLLVEAADVGHTKVDAVADRFASLGIEVERDVSRLQPDRCPVNASGSLVVIAVDNLALRRTLDHIRGGRVLEGGIGEGTDWFTRIQLHEFPGVRKARDVWANDDAKSSQGIDISKPAYQALLRETGDECGTTLVAGRSVATPFVGAVAGAMLAWCAGGSRLSTHALSIDVAAL